ncbi:hypothetical protein AAKU67_002240 [Oxalobacteraceae bacterium GrIS 2.11]
MAERNIKIVLVVLAAMTIALINFWWKACNA